jgi:transposase InsO family protein
VKSDNVNNFLERHIIYRFGVPHRITSGNAKAFKSNKMQRFIAKYNITWNYSTGYYPQANGLVEAFNKTMGKILKKTVTKNKKNDMITSLKLCGRNALPCAPQRKPPHIPWSMVAKLFCLLKYNYPHYGLSFIRKLPMMSKFDSDFKSLMPWKNVIFTLFRILSYIVIT